MNQDFAVYLIVGGAALYLVRLLWSATRGSSGCGGCGKCAASKAPQGAQSTLQPAGELIQIEMNGRPLIFSTPHSQGSAQSTLMPVEESRRK